MNLCELTRALVDIESITGNEEREVAPRRFNVLARWGNPVVTLSTHMDTVPPFFASREDDEFIWGRAACDTKGIIASMMHAAEALLKEGGRDFALLFVVGEERNSAGAYRAAEQSCGSKFLINGEPTENKLALGSKGALRYEIVAEGRMAHSAYPELGESAIDKLLSALDRIRHVELPADDLLGPSTLNIGTLSGGRAPNIIADQARAEIMIRLVGDSRVTRAFGGAWGQPFLIGPGTIHVAHTLEERVPKRQLVEAVEIYQRMVKQLWTQESKSAS